MCISFVIKTNCEWSSLHSVTVTVTAAVFWISHVISCSPINIHGNLQGTASCRQSGASVFSHVKWVIAVDLLVSCEVVDK